MSFIPPARHGQPWSEEEELELLHAVRRKETRKMMAEKHQRTESGIHAHLKELALAYYFNENRSIEEIMKFTGLEKDVINYSISKREQFLKRKELMKKSLKPIVTISAPIENELSVLKEIRDMMREMLELLKQKSSA